MSPGCNQFLPGFELMGDDGILAALGSQLKTARILSGRRMMSRSSRDRRRYLGVDFAIWSSGGSWFWLLINANGEAGTIGASANEAQAMRDAFLSIEEKLVF
jgi:hypothetical protein